MGKDNCEILFQYLKSILYDPEIQALDPETLEEPYQKLGRGLLVLQRQVEEMRAYTEELSRGNLSVPCPPRDNFLCENMKDLQSNLKHLTWQAQQVAAGDYSQHVSYLGDFSDAFNTMIAQLKERETTLKEEAEYVKSMAYIDPGTGLYNRQFFGQYMKQLLQNDQHATLCYLDMDGLKYVNDCYGHNEGDVYIRSMVEAVKHSSRKSDVFARIGGDEFCLVLPETSEQDAQERMQDILQRFVEENTKDYPESFSYGIIELEGSHQYQSLEEIIHQADVRMYQCKRKNKEKYHNIHVR